MKKITCTSQNMEAKTLTAEVYTLVPFGWLSPAAVHSADCWFDSWISGGSMFQPLLHIYAKKQLFVVLKQLQTTLWIINTLLFLINCEQTCHPLWTQLSHWQMFMQYLQFLCYLTQLQFMIGQNKFGEFLVFSRTTAKFGWPEHLASFVSVQLHTTS